MELLQLQGISNTITGATASTTNGLEQYVVQNLIKQYLTSSNLIAAGLGVAGLGVLIRSISRGMGRTIIILGSLMLIGGIIALYYGH